MAQCACHALLATSAELVALLIATSYLLVWQLAVRANAAHLEH
mgnify:CR=1 FL=1